MKSKSPRNTKKENDRSDKEKLLSELIRRRAIGPESRNDRTFLNYLAGQKYDEVYVKNDQAENENKSLQ